MSTLMPQATDHPMLPALPTLPLLAGQPLDIRSFGASEHDGQATHAAIQRAIERCSAAGGGRVVVPPGLWPVAGPVHLRSGADLHLEQDATLLFSDRPEDYLPVVFQQRGGVRCFNYSPLVYAHGCEDLAITGSGTLDGHGQGWWPWKQRQPGMKRLFEMGRDQVSLDERVFGTREDGVRPDFLQLVDCRRVLIEGVTFRNGPAWQVHPVCCDDLTIRGITVRAPDEAHNTDGIDPDCCRRVLLEDCLVDTGDDAICLKAGRDQDAWALARPCEDVTVRRCRVCRGHGGIVIGSEMSGDVRRVLVEDCRFEGTDRGIRLKSNRGRGGVVEQVVIRQIRMQNIKADAISIDLRYPWAELLGEALPTFRDIRIEDIRCTSAGRSLLLRGLPDRPLESITLDGLELAGSRPPVLEHVHRLDVGRFEQRAVDQA